MQTEGQRGGWLLPVLLGAVLGPALQLQQPLLWALSGYAWVAAPAALALRAAARWPAGPGGRGPVLLAAVAALSFSLTGVRACAVAGQQLDAALEGRDITATGLVAAMPQRTEGGLRFKLEVEQATWGGEPVQLPPQLHLGWYGGAMPGAGGLMELQRSVPGLRAGERWQLTVRLKAPHGNRNPQGFDYELWLWEQGLHATGYVRAGPRDPAPRRIADTGWYPVERARQAVRDAIERRVADRRVAGVLAGLVVGDQAAIDRADWDVFRATGVAHLMSISGLHITMFAWAAAALVGALWRRSARLCLAWPAPHAALAGGVLLAAGYALFSGWGVPAQRTVWMLAAVGALRLTGRRWPWPLVWLLAAAVVVAVDPWALMQAGFWLSFVAVGVLFATDAGQVPASSAAGPPGGQGAAFGSAGATRASPGGSAVRAAASVGALFREQWVVTLALTPLTLLLFGQVSVVGLVANALAIPWVTLIVTPLAMGGVAVPLLWDVATWAVQAMGLYLQWLAALPFAVASVAAPPPWAGAAGVLGGLLLAMRLPWHARLLGLPLLLPVLLWQAPRPPAGSFELLAADIGQGNAVIVRTAGHTLVYDAGPRYSREADAGHRVLVPLLRALDERVDVLMLSHRDSDHTGGAAAVLAMQPQAALHSSIEVDHELQLLRGSTRCEAGQRWQWDGVDFQVLHPQPVDYEVSRKPNALSCVLRIAAGPRVALLAGDIEQAQEARLVGQPGALKADVLLVPHHGSKTSSSAAFLDAVQPQLAVVQAGYRNRFGHPAPVVLERYRERAIRVIDSPRCGALWWSSQEPLAPRCEREERPRYWQHRIP